MLGALGTLPLGFGMLVVLDSGYGADNEVLRGNDEIVLVPEIGNSDSDTIGEDDPLGAAELVEFTSGYGGELGVLGFDVVSTG